MAADLIDYLAEMALLKDIEARDARIAALESKLAASESKCAELEGQIACRNQLRNELATERAARADAERVAVWAVLHDARHRLIPWPDGDDGEGNLIYCVPPSWSRRYIPANAHDPNSIYRALIEACEGGRDHG